MEEVMDTVISFEMSNLRSFTAAIRRKRKGEPYE